MTSYVIIVLSARGPSRQANVNEIPVFNVWPLVGGRQSDLRPEDCQVELKGPKGTKFAVFFSPQILLIFAFIGIFSIWEAQIFAENRMKTADFAENRRVLQKPACPI